jgi:hypothetical protein
MLDEVNTHANRPTSPISPLPIGRLKRSEAWLSNLLNIVMLPTPIQDGVASGKLPVSAALELTKLPGEKQVQTFNDLASSGEKLTATKVRQKRQEAHEATGEGGPVPRTNKQFRWFLETRSGPADPGHKLAAYLLDYLAGKKSDEQMGRYWDKAFPDNG